MQHKKARIISQAQNCAPIAPARLGNG